MPESAMRLSAGPDSAIGNHTCALGIFQGVGSRIRVTNSGDRVDAFGPRVSLAAMHLPKSENPRSPTLRCHAIGR